ncbi:MAG: xanthine dehydrogenase family protein subunit M [Bacteroidota bacterium]
MKPAPFRYEKPRSLEEALSILAQHGDDARPLAGGQSLVPLMNLRLARPEVLLDLNAISELNEIDADSGGVIRIGAMTRQSTLENDVKLVAALPLVALGARHIGHRQIRRRGTLGGNLSHADPASELPAVMIALDAHIVLQDQSGRREVPADEFFVGAYETRTKPTELMSDVLVRPNSPRSRIGFVEFARCAGAFALVGAAVSVDVADDLTCGSARIALCGAESRPRRLLDAENALIGVRLDPEAITAAARVGGESVVPLNDLQASGPQRRHLSSVAIRRALALAVGDQGMAA